MLVRTGVVLGSNNTPQPEGFNVRAAAVGRDSEVTCVTSAWSPLARVARRLCPAEHGG